MTPHPTPPPERETPPRKIWLQWHGDGSPDDAEPVDQEDITWCEDNINAHDVGYVHEDDHKAALRQRDELLEALRKLIAKCELRGVQPGSEAHQWYSVRATDINDARTTAALATQPTPDHAHE